jgi:hypothetical protein
MGGMQCMGAARRKMKRADYITRIGAAAEVQTVEDLGEVEEALASVLVMTALTRSSQPYSEELCETIANRLLKGLERLIAGKDALKDG